MNNKLIIRSGYLLLVVFLVVICASCAPSKKKTFRKSRKQYRKFRDYDCGCQNMIPLNKMYVIEYTTKA